MSGLPTVTEALLDSLRPYVKRPPEYTLRDSSMFAVSFIRVGPDSIREFSMLD